MEDIKVYFSCSLTKAPKYYKKAAFAFREAIRKIPGVTILDFCEPPIGQMQSQVDPADVYYNDIYGCVGNADIIISEISRPSSGLGIEINEGIRVRKIPCIMCKKENAVVSKLLLGFPAHENNATMLIYSKSPMELLPEITDYLFLFFR